MTTTEGHPRPAPPLNAGRLQELLHTLDKAEKDLASEDSDALEEEQQQA